jgi:hypothetical protein
MTNLLVKYTDRLKFADRLIRQKATGSPKVFARQLNISESHLYNILDELRLLGMPLAYDKTLPYYYSKPLQLRIEVSVVPLSEPESREIEGGLRLILNLVKYSSINKDISIFAT